jgi:hypothetical protein
MTPDNFRFTFMTFVFSVTLGLVISILDTPAGTKRYLTVKFGYVLPALLLMVDMWIRYNDFHSDTTHLYSNADLFLDTLLLAFLYAAVSGLKAESQPGDSQLSNYPPTRFWVWIIAYSVIKIVRTWDMAIVPGSVAWYTVLHGLLLLLIIGGWLWQARGLGLPRDKFWYSGIVFSVVVFAYLAAVYCLGFDPLGPVPLP